MKNIILILTLLVLSVPSFGQNYKSFYKTHKNEDSVVSFSAPINLARFFIDDDDEVSALLKKGKKVRILIFEENTNLYYKNLKKDLSSDLYDSFLYIKDKDAKIEIFVRDNDKAISEIILFIKGENELVTMGIYGDFTYEDLSELSQSTTTE